MNATVECTTTSTNGRLQWKINDGPVLYTIDNAVYINDSTIIDGSVFVFTNSSLISGATMVTSTASLNTSHVKSVQCSDGVVQESLTIQFQGKHTQ